MICIGIPKNERINGSLINFVYNDLVQVELFLQIRKFLFLAVREATRDGKKLTSQSNPSESELEYMEERNF